MKKFLVVVGLVAAVVGSFLFGMDPAGSSQYAGTNGMILYTRQSFVSQSAASVNLINPDGTGDTAVVSGATGGSQNASSTKIAYIDQSGSLDLIRVANFDGSSPVTIASAAAGHFFPWANMSADGTKVAYVDRDGGASSTSLIVINADGTGAVTLTTVSNYIDWPQFSADGTRILYSEFGSGLFSIPTSGGAATQIAPAGIVWGSWTTDGKILAVDGAADAIVRMNADGTGTTVLLTAASINKADVFWPMVSPDGTKMSFTANSQGPMSLYVANADGSSPTVILAGSSGSSGFDPLFPVWSGFGGAPTPTTVPADPVAPAFTG